MTITCEYLERINVDFFFACQYGNLDLVLQLIERGANDWNMGLHYACFGGNIIIINMMIERGAISWNQGLRGACLAGNIYMALYMIYMGANEFEPAISAAKSARAEELVILLKSLLEIQLLEVSRL